jgi:hypothetical protein
MWASYQQARAIVRLIINEESQQNEEYSLTIIEMFKNDEDL